MSDWEAPVVSQLAGHFNSENMMHAVALARWCGVSEEHIRQGLSEYRPQLMRSQYIKGDGLNILLDAYNANPSSMEAALRSFVAEAHRPFGFILGDMLEMGKAAEIRGPAVRCQRDRVPGPYCQRGQANDRHFGGLSRHQALHKTYKCASGCAVSTSARRRSSSTWV